MKHPHRKHGGFSLVELMVALSIGSLLIAGAVFVYSQSRTSFTLNESQARLQEDARYVMSILEPEIQLAGLYGFTNQPGDFRYTEAGSETFIADLRQDDPEFADVPAAVHACGTNYVLDLFMTIQGSNDAYDWAPAGSDCAAQGGGAVAATDTLTLRRASLAAEAVDPDRIQLYVSRITPNNNMMFSANAAPGPVTAGAEEVRNLVVQGFYISTDSEGFPGVPALRRKSLIAGPAFIDEEIMRGVEDLQVQFGVDLGDDLDGDGVPDDLGADGLADFVDGNATRYVDPDDPILTSAQVVSVRIWIRVRALNPEPGYVNNNTYQYGTTDFTADDNFRRVVVSRTIVLRNARVMTGAAT